MLSDAINFLRGRSPRTNGSSTPPLKKYVIIRYNVRASFTPKTETGWLNLDPDWLETRHQLFFRYCLPSLEAQNDQDFTTILIFDNDTPKPALDAIRKACKPIRAEIVFSSGRGGVRSILEKDRNGAFVATTRLDSDDALAPTFMSHLRDYATTLMAARLIQKPVCVTFSTGQQYVVDRKEYRRYVYPGNAFCTLLRRLMNP